MAKLRFLFFVVALFVFDSSFKLAVATGNATSLRGLTTSLCSVPCASGTTCCYENGKGHVCSSKCCGIAYCGGYCCKGHCLAEQTSCCPDGSYCPGTSVCSAMKVGPPNKGLHCGQQSNTGTYNCGGYHWSATSTGYIVPHGSCVWDKTHPYIILVWQTDSNLVSYSYTSATATTGQVLFSTATAHTGSLLVVGNYGFRIETPSAIIWANCPCGAAPVAGQAALGTISGQVVFVTTSPANLLWTQYDCQHNVKAAYCNACAGGTVPESPCSSR